MRSPEQIDRQVAEFLVPSPNRAALPEHPATWHDTKMGLHVYPVEVIDQETGETRQDIDMAVIELDVNGRSPVTVFKTTIDYEAQRRIMTGKMLVIRYRPSNVNDTDDGVTFHYLDADSKIPEGHSYELLPGDAEVMFAVDGACNLHDESQPSFRPDFEDVVVDDDPSLSDSYRQAIQAIADSSNRFQALNNIRIERSTGTNRR